MRSIIGIAIVGLLALAGGYWYYSSFNINVAKNDAPPAGSLTPQAGHEEMPPQPSTASQGASIGEENAVDLRCTGGKTITAVFARDIVGLTLSDGRQIELRQATTENGLVYFNSTRTIELRGGSGPASLIENGVATYGGCVVAP